MTRASLAALVLALVAAPASAAERPWINLFDGKTLNGWVQRGGAAKYEVKDGTIVGTTVPNTKNSFLCTERSYGDFVLEVEFKVDPRLNSGIQIRGQSKPEYQDGRVHGLQVEIDPDTKRNRMWTGGLYEEGRRGWLNDLKDNEAARKAFKPEEWNKIRVEAMGESVRTWINDVPAADLVDSLELEGFIALQVHSVGKREEPIQVAWRNIRIQDHGRHVWRSLWDGKGLNGFRPVGGGSWSVKEGVLVGLMRKSPRVDRLVMDGPSTRNGLLFTERTFGDFTARLEYRITGFNSGLYFRAEPAAWPVGARGLQVDIDPTTGAGALYETGGRGWIVKRRPDKKVKPGDWQSLTVSARGGRVTVHGNNLRTASFLEDPGAREGKLALELIAGHDVKLEVRRFDVLSEPVPPPVPSYPIGWCIRATGSAPDDAKAAGFEYVELALQDVLSLPDEEFEKAVARFAALGVPAVVGYNIVPNDLMLVGPAADKAKQDQHLEKALGRAKRLGLKMVVLNSGAARKVPEGFSPQKGWQQLVDFSRRAAARAKKHGITFLVQPLRSEDTNLVTNVPEALKLIQAVGRPNFKLLVDYSYMAMKSEDPAVLHKARAHLKHVWISNPNGRTYPTSTEEADYAAFFAALKKIGYRGGVSIHARTDNFYADAPPAMSFLRKMAAEHL
jgi:sugar phosphate isomerase/epimerase